MDRSYVPEVELLTWEEISGNILQEISSTKAEKSPELSYDYLPLSGVISFAERNPPKMTEIKNPSGGSAFCIKRLDDLQRFSLGAGLHQI